MESRTARACSPASAAATMPLMASRYGAMSSGADGRTSPRWTVGGCGGSGGMSYGVTSGGRSMRGIGGGAISAPVKGSSTVTVSGDRCATTGTDAGAGAGADCCGTVA